MDIISILGILVALGSILGGQALEGGHIGSLLQVTAFLIVMGGTIGAVMLQTPKKAFLHGLKLAKWVFMPPHADAKALIDQTLAWSNTARKSGLLALEAEIEQIQDVYHRKALQMLVDGAEPEALRDVLSLENDAFDHFNKQSAKIWEAAGGYAPTLGILGAVMGLIHVMENLSDPSKLGGGIAVAFVATIYGVGAANLFFLPIANKIKAQIEHQIMLRELLLEGLVCIANGENPRMIESKLNGYLV